jgi:cell division protein FtsB
VTSDVSSILAADDKIIHLVIAAFGSLMGITMWLLNRSIQRLDTDIKEKASKESLQNLDEKLDNLKDTVTSQFDQVRAGQDRVMDWLMNSGKRP